MGGIGRYATLAAFGLLALTGPAHADYVTRTYQFDQSNTLASMLNYGSVTVEAYDGNGASQNGLAAGQVRLTYHADPLPIYGPPGPHFGIRMAGFNTDLPLSLDQLSVPDNWRVRNDRFMGGFGRFGWQAYASPPNSLTDVAVTVSGLGADALLDHFLIPSKTSTGDVPAMGSVYFAARVGGFDINTDDIDAASHVVGTGFPLPPPTTWPPEGPPSPIPDPPVGGGGEMPPDSPEPAAALLGLLGAAGVGVTRWRRRAA
jgi:hypothetical protein